MSDQHASPHGSDGSAPEASSNEPGLRPAPGLEIIEGREFLAENVAISGRHFIRCSFNFCNLIYSGGPVGLVECGGAHNELVEVGPVKEAITGHGAEAIRDKMLRYWKDVRRGLNLTIPEVAGVSRPSQSSEPSESLGSADASGLAGTSGTPETEA